MKKNMIPDKIQSAVEYRCLCVKCGKLLGKILPGSTLHRICERCGTELYFILEESGVMTTYSKGMDISA